MFHIKRVFKAKPGQARKVATLAYRAAESYHQAGMRSGIIGKIIGQTANIRGPTTVI